MKNIAGTSISLGSGSYIGPLSVFVYAYNNAGTCEVRFEASTGAGVGATPTFDTALDYWKNPSTGAEARRIGKLWINASGEIIWFRQFGHRGRYRKTMMVRNAAVLLSGGTATSYTSITITPYYTGDDDSMILAPKSSNSGASTGFSSCFLSVDGGAFDAIAIQNGVIHTTGSVTTLFGQAELPYSGTLHYKNNVSTGSQAHCDASGFGQFV
jgi:hypothetical protein